MKIYDTCRWRSENTSTKRKRVSCGEAVSPADTRHRASTKPQGLTRLRFVLVFLAILLVAATGCQHSQPVVAGSGASTSDLTVTDRLDREVRFEAVPDRIVSLSPSTTELLFAIGAGDKIVGATEHCNYPEAAKAIPRVGSGLLDGISREAILALKPDLVLCKWDSHAPLIDFFERVGVAVVAVGPESLEELFEEAELLGKVTGNTAGAKTLTTAMTQQNEQLMARVKAIPKIVRLTVFYEVWDDPLMTAGPESFIGELLATAGLQNIFADTEIRFPRVSSEVVVARNPHVILAPSDHAEQITLQQLNARPGWEKIRAVQNESVYLINGDLVSRCGPRMLDALEEMIDVVYGPAGGSEQAE